MAKHFPFGENNRGKNRASVDRRPSLARQKQREERTRVSARKGREEKRAPRKDEKKGNERRRAKGADSKNRGRYVPVLYDRSSLLVDCDLPRA